MTGLFTRLLCPSAGDRPSAAANLLLRLVAGGMLFWVHGVHKAEGAYAHYARGEGWTLLDEVRGMGTPLPEAAAVFATAVQLVAPLLLVAGFWTRPAALLLAAVLAGAVVQNLSAGRDSQLAVLYTLASLTLGVWGAGRYSLDARFNRSPNPLTSSDTERELP